MTGPRPSPAIYRKWAAISTISAALERRAYTVLFGLQLFPNQYITLIGGPATGKSVAIMEAIDLVNETQAFSLAPSNVSKASLVDALAKAVRKVIPTSPTASYLEYNSLYVAASELGIFLTEYSTEFVTFLTSMWDNVKYDEWKRTGDKKIVIERGQLNFIAGTTPSALGELLPEGAWDQGFTSRTLFIFSDEKILVDPLAIPDRKTDVSLRNSLVADLKQICTLQGQFFFTAEAGAAFSQWHMFGQQPQPDHPKLVHYLGRRTNHLAKICMAVSASRSNDLLITKDDFETALGWLLEIEVAMPEIFKAMTIKGGDSNIIHEAYQYVYKAYMRDRKPVPQHKLIFFLQQRLPPHSVLRVLQNMVASQMLQESFEGGRAFYTPLSLSI